MIHVILGVLAQPDVHLHSWNHFEIILAEKRRGVLFCNDCRTISIYILSNMCFINKFETQGMLDWTRHTMLSTHRLTAKYAHRNVLWNKQILMMGPPTRPLHKNWNAHFDWWSQKRMNCNGNFLTSILLHSDMLADWVLQLADPTATLVCGVGSGHNKRSDLNIWVETIWPSSQDQPRCS